MSTGTARKQTGGSQISESFRERAEELAVPASVLTLAHKGEIYFVTGGVDPEALDRLLAKGNPLGCLCGVLTAHAVLELVRRGTLRLDAPAAEILSYDEPRLDEPLQGVQLGHLLSHTAGLAPWPHEHGLRLYLGGADGPGAAHARLERLFPAGRYYAYEPLDFMLLGQVLRAVTSRPWFDTIRELVLAPLGCDASFSTDWADGDPPPGLEGLSHDPLEAALAEHVYLGPEDLCRYGGAHLASDGPEGVSWIAEQMRSAPDWAPERESTAILGFAWKHMAEGGYGHAGVTSRSHTGVCIHAGKDMCAAVLTDGRTAQLFGEGAGRLGMISASTAVYETTKSQEAVPAKARTGAFRRGKTTLRISESADGLKIRRRSPGAPASDDRFTAKPVTPRVAQGQGDINLDGDSGNFYVEYLGLEPSGRFDAVRIRDQLYVADGS